MCPGLALVLEALAVVVSAQSVGSVVGLAEVKPVDSGTRNFVFARSIAATLLLNSPKVDRVQTWTVVVTKGNLERDGW